MTSLYSESDINVSKCVPCHVNLINSTLYLTVQREKPMPIQADFICSDFSHSSGYQVLSQFSPVHRERHAFMFLTRLRGRPRPNVLISLLCANENVLDSTHTEYSNLVLRKFLELRQVLRHFTIRKIFTISTVIPSLKCIEMISHNATDSGHCQRRACVEEFMFRVSLEFTYHIF